MPVVFQEDNEFARPESSAAAEPPRLIRVVLSTGIVSTEKDAQYVLLGTAALLLLIAAGVLFAGFGGRHAPTPQSMVDAAMRARAAPTR